MIQCDRTIKNVCKSIRDGAGFLHETAQERLLRVKFKLDLKKKKKNEQTFARWIPVCRKAFITSREHYIWQTPEELKKRQLRKAEKFLFQIIGRKARNSRRWGWGWDMGRGTFRPWQRLCFLLWVMENHGSTFRKFITNRRSNLPFLALFIFHFSIEACSSSQIETSVL